MGATVGEKGLWTLRLSGDRKELNSFVFVVEVVVAVAGRIVFVEKEETVGTKLDPLFYSRK